MYYYFHIIVRLSTLLLAFLTYLKHYRMYVGVGYTGDDKASDNDSDPVT